MSLKKYFTKGANSQNEAGEGVSSQIGESSKDEVEGGPSSLKKDLLLKNLTRKHEI